MKKLLISVALLGLAACSSKAPNLLGTDQPILNIAANLAPLVDVRTASNAAYITNKSQQQLKVFYHLYWYNAQGVTQLWPQQQESLAGNLVLQAKQQQMLSLAKPTPESTNYRLYLQ
jgi:uncharacterized protein HI_0960